MKFNRKKTYQKIVENKFHLYNSLFMNLPFTQMTEVGVILPLMHSFTKKALENGQNPVDIIPEFFSKHLNLNNEQNLINILFVIIQYIERQVVLFDSIEDASFPSIHPEGRKGRFSALQNLGMQNNNLDKIREKFQDFKIRIVFTAHPTQFYPNEVQLIIEDLRAAIQKDSVTQIDSLLKQLGRTSFIKKKKPTPLDEAMSIIHYLRHVYYESVLEVNRKLKQYFFDQETELPTSLVELGFWPGGDRDGNPFVTPEITLQVTHELRKAILKCYYHHLKVIRRRLSFKGVIEILDSLSSKLYENMFADTCNLTYHEILDTLFEAKECLIKNHDNLFLSLLDELIQQVKAFGLHFASLDIRQDSQIHNEILNKIVSNLFPEKENYEVWSLDEKFEFLKDSHHHKIDLDQIESPRALDTLKNLQQLKSIQKTNGEKSVHRYIISNSTKADDVLHVFQLFVFAGWKLDHIPFDIVPLFETMEGMEGAEKAMQLLYKNKFYKGHLDRRKDKQTIMLGFSDGTKDGGYVSANWEIYRTKESMTQLARKYHLDVVFFDGRGGPPARGGGKTHQFYASQGRAISNKELQLTIQGQTITSTFGTIEQSVYNFEQLVSAGIMNTCFHNEKKEFSIEERKLMNDLSELSQKKYKELKAHPLFVPYLEHISTLKYYARTNIGSRPSKRNAGVELRFKDLRAIPFVGSWSQLKQNIPGFFGFGTAIQKYIDAGEIGKIQNLYSNSAFFKSLLLNSMMSMEKTYFPLTFYLQNDKIYGDFWKILYDEFLLTRENMLKITGFTTLMEKEQISKKSIEIREKIVLPLLCIQQFALEKIKENNSHKEVYEKMVTRSLFGNINASRNSA